MPDCYDRQGNSISMDEWSRRKDELVVGKTDLPAADASVSTVWLGMDHGWGHGPPLIFETMVFGGAFSESQERYSTEVEAVAGHRRWVDRVAAEQEAFEAAIERPDVRATVELLGTLVFHEDAPFDFDRYARAIKAGA